MMHHEKLNWMRDCLICAAESQICDLEEVDAKELGEVIDMIKDIEEAIYYSTVTAAMHNNPWEETKENSDERMYADSGKKMRMGGMYYSDNMSNSEMMESSKHHTGPMTHGEHDGRSYMNRRMYMEAKNMNKDKATQLHELEKYMQELSQDITEMIADASLEEKQYLEKKVTALASKIGQMK